MTDQPKRYTLDEAQRELKRRYCASDGHRPDIVLRDGFGTAHLASCDCGEVVWRPETNDVEASR